VIPAYKPSAGLVDLVQALSAEWAPAIVIVDDGSGPDFRGVFDRVKEFPNVQLLRHAVNLGKGMALKTAINHTLCAFPDLVGIVTADADGQHHPEDIQRVADALMEQPGSLILGSRHFDQDVPLRSRFGNIATRSVMHALLGQKLTDTQTGLRGIPANFLPRLLRHESTGYEFELEMLIAAHELTIPIVEVPIRTIYEPGNKSSHFNPIVDSMKIYFVLLRFGSVSFLSAMLDTLVYALVWKLTANEIASLAIGRVVSVCFNYSMVRSSVFYSHQKHKTVLPKYLTLVAVSALAAYGGIHFFRVRVGFSAIPAKLIVETILFFVNFAVQRLFIFNKSTAAAGSEGRTAPVLAFSILVATAFTVLLGLEIYGFATSHLFAQNIWYPIGIKRFTRFVGVFLALAVPLLAMMPWSFPGTIAALVLALSAVALGPLSFAAIVFFLISCCALGSLILGRSRKDDPLVHVCATLLGAGVYVALMAVAARMPVNYPAAWIGALALPIVLDLPGVMRRLRYWIACIGGMELRCPWARVSFGLLTLLLVAHWLLVFKPETSADGLAMHLAAPANIAANHMLTYTPGHVLWSVMPMGGDWTYSIVYLLGGEYAARMLNFCWLVALVALVYFAARRWVSDGVAFLLAASFAATPIVQLVTGSLFVENFLAALVLAYMAAIWLFGDTGERRFLIAAAVLGGAALTTKYGALVFVILGLPFAIGEMARRWKSLGPRPWAVCAVTAVLLVAVAAPTYVIAYQKTGNPIYPFLNDKIHSPLLNPKVEFADYRFKTPLDWSMLYRMTFQTTRFFEGQSGSLGFQYLLIIPLGLIGLLVCARRQSSAAALLAIGAAIAIMLSTPNVRYLYTSMALATVPLAGLLAWLDANERWMMRVVVVYLFAATVFNIAFLPAAGFYQKDFALRLPFSRAERERYLLEAAPVRAVVAWYNEHHPGATVLLTADSTIAGLNGTFYANHWHQYPTWEALQQATTLPAMQKLMEQWKVGYFIAHKPAPGEEAHPAALQVLLDRCTVPEYEAGEYYLARLEPDCVAKSSSVTVSRGTYDDFDPAVRFDGDWIKDSSFDGPDRHTISYTDTAGAIASLKFEGSELIYVFTKAPNRGIAAISLDGADAGTIDLYAPQVEWQSRQKICCTTRGQHEVSIRVTGTANTRAAGRFVDLDSFQVW